MLLAEKPQIDPVVALLRAKHNFPEMIASISFEAIASPAVQDNSDILIPREIIGRVFDLMDDPETR